MPNNAIIRLIVILLTPSVSQLIKTIVEQHKHIVNAEKMVMIFAIMTTNPSNVKYVMKVIQRI